MKSKDIAEKKGTGLVDASMYEDDADAGFENADADSYAIPFLTILQALSPQCTKSDGAYIDGAESGMLFNSVSEKYSNGDEGLYVVPVHYKRAFIEWGQREKGGGFVAEHSVADGIDLLQQTKKNDKGHDVLPNDNILVDTRSHYIIVVQENGEMSPAILSMSSTQMKKSKKWMSIMQNIKMERSDGSKFTPSMFSYKYRLTTIPESNDKGSWFGWKITISEKTNAEIYNVAKKLRDDILKGTAQASAPAPDAETEAPEKF